MENKAPVQVLKEKFPDAILGMDDFRGDLSIRVKGDNLLSICKSLREDERTDMDLLLDLCGVHYPQKDHQFEVVYHLYSLTKKHHLRLKVPLKESDGSVESVIPVWKTANWFEREAYDLFGIKFKNHPNLRRLLCHENFKGHALRKDYPPDLRHPCHEVVDLITDNTIENPEDREFFETGEKPPRREGYIVNIGPSHPATHGTLRIQVLMDGETIVRAEQEIGYLHRCFEKMAETHDYYGVMPYTDRLNYCSSFMNNVGYAMAVEKLMGIEIPPRARYIRVILSEFSRIMDHLTCIGPNLVDLGALTNYWYTFQPREEIYGLLESCCGGRLTVAYARIGGLTFDVPEDFEAQCRAVLKMIPPLITDVDKLNKVNPIFQKRTREVGVMSAEDAIQWGWTGPCLRAAGVPYDVRKAHPYYDYDKYDFDIPVGTIGDTYDRYLVRMEEIRQSIRIIDQYLEHLPGGPVQTDDLKVNLPPKDAVYNKMEELIYHFKLVMHGILPPEGEVYSFTEGANGELGYYIVSDGTKNPYRIKVRPPCFPVFQAFGPMIEGLMIADAVATLGSINIIAGELDR